MPHEDLCQSRECAYINFLKMAECGRDIMDCGPGGNGGGRRGKTAICG